MEIPSGSGIIIDLGFAAAIDAVSPDRVDGIDIVGLRDGAGPGFIPGIPVIGVVSFAEGFATEGAAA